MTGLAFTVGDETELWGELWSDEEIPETYKIFETNHRLVRKTGTHLRDEKIKENHVRLMYKPMEWEEEDF